MKKKGQNYFLGPKKNSSDPFFQFLFPIAARFSTEPVPRVPLSAPAFVVVGIFQFTNIWNDFLFGVTVVFNPADQPVTVALNNLSGTTSVDWTAVMGGAMLAALPTMLVYILLGRYFIRGLLSGSLKG